MRSRSSSARQSSLREAGRHAARLGAPRRVMSSQRKVFMYNNDSMPLEDLHRRALSAYFESGGDLIPQEPRVHKIKGKRYVTLWRGKKMLACYRVRNDGKLKRLVRVPEGLQ